MRRIIETTVFWSFTQSGGMEISRLRGARLRDVTGRFLNVGDLKLQVDFIKSVQRDGTVGYTDTYDDIKAIVSKRPEIMSRAGVENCFPRSGEVWINISVPRHKKEDACATIYRAFTTLFEGLGIDGRLWVSHSNYPTITQTTWWRARPSDPRNLWTPHGEYIAKNTH